MFVYFSRLILNKSILYVWVDIYQPRRSFVLNSGLFYRLKSLQSLYVVSLSVSVPLFTWPLSSFFLLAKVFTAPTRIFSSILVKGLILSVYMLQKTDRGLQMWKGHKWQITLAFTTTHIHCSKKPSPAKYGSFLSACQSEKVIFRVSMAFSKKTVSINHYNCSYPEMLNINYRLT